MLHLLSIVKLPYRGGNIRNKKIQYQSDLVKFKKAYCSHNLCLVIWIFLEDYKALHDRRERKVLVCGQFCPLSMRKQDWSCVRLETGNCLGLTCLPNHINSLRKRQENRLIVKFSLQSIPVRQSIKYKTTSNDNHIEK